MHHLDKDKLNVQKILREGDFGLETGPYPLNAGVRIS